MFRFLKAIRPNALTLSPNKKFYYKFQDPRDMYWGLFCCDVAFFSLDDTPIYYTAGQFAQCGFDPGNIWAFVFYSASGNLVFFVERHSTKTLFHVIIDLANKKIFRQPFTTEDESKTIIETFAKSGFPDKEAIYFAADHFQDIQTSPLTFEFKNLFGMRSWRP